MYLAGRESHVDNGGSQKSRRGRAQERREVLFHGVGERMSQLNSSLFLDESESPGLADTEALAAAMTIIRQFNHSRHFISDRSLC